MPASVMLVHDERNFVDQLATALRRVGCDVAAFVDPMAALSGLDASGYLEVLVTRVLFAPGKVNGVALARIARSKRPGIRVLFIELPEFEGYTEGLGKFMPLPVSVPDVVGVVASMLAFDVANSN
jgi:DNA-binding NtrC family response regulator